MFVFTSKRFVVSEIFSIWLEKMLNKIKPLANITDFEEASFNRGLDYQNRYIGRNLYD